ncbi:MAG: hypothetical protein AAF439_00395 [Pseudomonadota bacterium]
MRLFSVLPIAILLTVMLPPKERAEITTGNVLKDAYLIIADTRGRVILWDRAPRVLIISADPRAKKMMETIRDRIETEVKPPFGPPFFESWTYVPVAKDWPKDDVRLSLRAIPKNKRGRGIAVSLPEVFTGNTDIAVVIADRKTTAVINGLWGMKGWQARHQAEGDERGCFYQTIHYDQVRESAYVSVVAPEEDNELFDCLWQEMMLAFGGLKQAQLSVYFSINHGAKNDRTRTNDLLLMRALYESGAGPGGRAETVIEYFDKLFRRRWP